MIKTLLKYLFRLIWIPTELFFAILFCLFTYILYSAHIEPPSVPNTSIGKREKVGPNHYVLGNNYLTKVIDFFLPCISAKIHLEQP